MSYDYVISGDNINSLMLAYYLNKEKYNVLIIKKPLQNIKLFEFSNNDVNFLNFLSDIKIDFKSVGHKLDRKFDLTNFNMSELFMIYVEMFNQLTNDYSSKNIKLKDKLHYFSDKAINYIKILCTFYNLNFDEMSYYDLTEIISNCMINEYYILDEQKLITQIYDYFLNKTNIEIKTDNDFTINLSQNDGNTIEDNIKQNYLLLNKIINKKKFKIYKNDTIVDIVKLCLLVKLIIK